MKHWTIWQKYNQWLYNWQIGNREFGKMNKKLLKQYRLFRAAFKNFEKSIELYKVKRTMSVDDQIEYINYYMKLIKIDLASSHKLDAMYGKVWNDDLFPESYKPKIWIVEKLLIKTGQKIEKTLDEATYISTWRESSFVESFFLVKDKGFIEDENHIAYYYPEIDLLQVINGKHSATVGTVLGGKVRAEVVSLAKFVDRNIVTDGAYWYSIKHDESDKRIGIVEDFRIALLYQLYLYKEEILRSRKH